MSDEEPLTFAEVCRIIDSLPAPKVDAFHIRSEQERQALREHMDFYRSTVDQFCGALSFGVPVHVVDDTPPGVLRAMLDGEVVEDVPIR